MPTPIFITVEPPSADPYTARGQRGDVLLWMRTGGKGEFTIAFNGTPPTPSGRYNSTNGVIAAPILHNTEKRTYEYTVSNPGGGSSGDPEVVVF